jgi:Tfp pilus assembly protein PilE
VELLLVISIVAVLTAIAVFAMNGVGGRSNRTACQVDVAAVQKASDAYYIANNAYASDIPTLVTANLLRNAPANSSYTVNLSTSGGASSSTPACSTL